MDARSRRFSRKNTKGISREEMKRGTGRKIGFSLTAPCILRFLLLFRRRFVIMLARVVLNYKKRSARRAFCSIRRTFIRLSKVLFKRNALLFLPLSYLVASSLFGNRQRGGHYLTLSSVTVYDRMMRVYPRNITHAYFLFVNFEENGSKILYTYNTTKRKEKKRKEKGWELQFAVRRG